MYICVCVDLDHEEINFIVSEGLLVLLIFTYEGTYNGIIRGLKFSSVKGKFYILSNLKNMGFL